MIWWRFYLILHIHTKDAAATASVSAFSLGWHHHKTGRAQHGELGWCHPCTPITTAVPLSVPQCLWKRLDTTALMMLRRSETRWVGRKKDSNAGRGIYRNKSPPNFKNIEYCIRRLHLSLVIPRSKSTTIPRRALRAVVEQQVGLGTVHLRHEQINSSRRAAAALNHCHSNPSPLLSGWSQC